MPNALASDASNRVQNGVASWAMGDDGFQNQIPQASHCIPVDINLRARDVVQSRNAFMNTWDTLTDDCRNTIMSNLAGQFVVGMKIITFIPDDGSSTGWGRVRGIGFRLGGEVVHNHQKDNGWMKETYIPVQAPGPQLLTILRNYWSHLWMQMGAELRGITFTEVCRIRFFLRGVQSNAFNAAYGNIASQ